MEPYKVRGKVGLREWRSVVHAIERNLVLTRHRDGILTHELSEYLYDRSTGYMGSLITLINWAATLAIIDGGGGHHREVARTNNDRRRSGKPATGN